LTIGSAVQVLHKLDAQDLWF